MDARIHCRVVAMAATLLFTGLVTVSHARPTIRASFFSAYPTAVGSRLDSTPSKPGHCGMCHFDFNGGGLKNAYGTRLAAVIGNFSNSDAGRQQAMHSIENEDMDADGFTALTEITNTSTYANTPTFPGLTPTNVGSCVNVPLAEITGYLVPTTGADTQPPVVTLTAPNGGQSWTGNLAYSITWTATDNVGVVGIDLWHRESPVDPWKPIASGLSNSGTYTWFVPARPTTTALVKVRAVDAAGNAKTDSSDAVFAVVRAPGGIVPTTLRDFDQPGSQPLDAAGFANSSTCITCHGGYDSAVEPGHNAMGSMMMQSFRDPLFLACLTMAEQDAPGAGDLCIRCHTPFGWMGGRSTPTSGTQVTVADRDGIACDFCHRLVDPAYEAGVSPAEDQTVLGALLPSHVPTNFSNGQYVLDPIGSRRRGPYADAVAPHGFLSSPFHRSSDLCGTCHDVSNPVFTRVAGQDYAPNGFDSASSTFDSEVLLPLERTYSEWKASAFPAGVYAPDFAGDRPDGTVSSCQDCHMRAVTGKGCNDPAAPVRADLPLHDLMGGNAWMPSVSAALYPTETDAGALADGAARAVSMLQKAATVAVTVAAEADSFRATVTVTNRAGHKLPTGYPEGRRMWLHVVARDASDAIVYESGAYDPATGVLTHDANAVIYEIKLGISPGLAAAVGATSGASFHFTLNDTVLSDIRIPPQGFTQSAFAAFGGAPVDPHAPGGRYADGQHWDAPTFALPPSARSVMAELRYQSTSREYVEFLRDGNVTDTRGTTLHDAWVASGRAAPVTMAADSFSFATIGVPDGPRSERVRLATLRNPAVGSVALRLDLPSPARVRLEVLDAQGRRVSTWDAGRLGPGSHRLTWDGRDAAGADAGAGVYWLRVRVDDHAYTERIARLR